MSQVIELRPRRPDKPPPPAPKLTRALPWLRRIAESLALDGLTHEQPIISRSATP